MNIKNIKQHEKKVEKKIGRGVDAGVFKPEFAEAMKACVNYTMDYGNVAGSNIVLEAATEDETIKDKIFSQVEKLTDENCICCKRKYSYAVVWDRYPRRD